MVLAKLYGQAYICDDLEIRDVRTCDCWFNSNKDKGHALNSEEQLFEKWVTSKNVYLCISDIYLEERY